VQFSSDDAPSPQAQPSKDPQASFLPFWHFLGTFLISSYLMIPKTPKSNPERIIKDPLHHFFTISTL
jgi:hypothetical protein